MQDFLERPMAQELREIFGDPQPPAKVTQRQFDGADADLRKLASASWEEILKADDWWAFLMDLKYTPLQRDLFDYVFPALLIAWYRGQLSQWGLRQTETDFYSALSGGNVLSKMLAPDRYLRVLDWMARAYLEGIDGWTGDDLADHGPDGPYHLHGPLSTLNALGQSVPVLEPIFHELLEIRTLGRARFWLVMGTGIVWNENECPHLTPWDPEAGGGGVYALTNDASIFEHGFLPSNLESANAHLSYDSLLGALRASRYHLENSSQRSWYQTLIQRYESEPGRIKTRLANLIAWYAQPDLGGVLRQPLDNHPRDGKRPWWRF